MRKATFYRVICGILADKRPCVAMRCISERSVTGRRSLFLSRPVVGVWLYFRGVLSAVSYAFSLNSVQYQYKDDGKIVAEKTKTDEGGNVLACLNYMRSVGRFCRLKHKNRQTVCSKRLLFNVFGMSPVVAAGCVK